MWRVGRSLYMRARNDVPNDMRTNGEIALVKKVLRDSSKPVLFDVGANLGEWTNLVLAEAPKESSLHAFEPIEATFSALKMNVIDPRARLNRLGLSDSEHSLTAYEYGSGTNSLHLDPTEPVPNTQSVPTTTLDRYAIENGIEEITYLKCDTEGHDLAVLRGSSDALQAGVIGVFQFEYNHRWIFSRGYLLDVFELIADLPYFLGKIIPGGIEVFDEWHPELERFFEGNYALVRNDLKGRLPLFFGTFDASNTYTAR